MKTEEKTPVEDAFFSDVIHPQHLTIPPGEVH